MRFIRKSEEPAELASYRSYNNATYKNFTENQVLYNRVKQQLIDDQLGLCCYCGTGVELKTAHIEHLQDQHSNKSQQLTYSNFLASCNGGCQQEHCGHAKGHRCLPVTPLQENCMERFEYRTSGQVDAKLDSTADRDAQAAINILNLNTVRLRNQRKAALSNSGLFDEGLSVEDIEEFIELYSSPNEQGKLEPFSQAIISRLRQEKSVLQRQLAMA
ncbi:retron system putative HNH endonuclease [Endozoicomonas sp. 4G]|uniref:retron system putative HNH endonuclease n=1 Tax=Endozoicomonas sp. 4G TaxID=2872754 RepID=UPI0020789F9C|nr:retron system putative HNH endonuclease [Endozoicomonas sp. 4G]